MALAVNAVPLSFLTISALAFPLTYEQYSSCAAFSPSKALASFALRTDGTFLSSNDMWRRSGRLGIASIIALVLLIVFELHRHGNLRDHYLEPNSALNHIEFSSVDTFSPSNDWDLSCRQHGFSPYTQPRKVFDLVLFSTELDWLEIRLHTHAPYVDYFVIIESPTTFTHRPKSLHLKESWDRYRHFHHKMIYRVIEDPIISARHWDHEDYLRDALLEQIFPSLEGGPYTANQDDVLIVSDMDEILRPGTLRLLRYCNFAKRLTLRSSFYYYSFQWLHKGDQWAHPQATVFGSSIENTIAPNDLRQNLLGPGLPPFAALSRWWEQANLWNAGWHCSSCFSTIAETQTKMDSFSHQSWNTEENRDPRTIVHRVRNGLDLFARPDELYDRIDNNTDVPPYILAAFEHRGRFKYLLDRDGDNAGFDDFPGNAS